MTIIFRTYKSGDETELAALFNKAFHQEGIGFLRTPNLLKWRYVDRPHANPDEIQIAVDQQINHIVGSVFSTIEQYEFQNRIYRVGSINDVAVLPGYGGQGIAKTLMKQAMRFCTEQQCDLSILVADPHGHAHSHIYTPLGYEDFIPFIIWFKPTLFLAWYFPILLPFLPLYLLFLFGLTIRSHFYYPSRLKIPGINVDHAMQRISGRPISHTSQLNAAFNQYMPQLIEGFTHFSTQEWSYFREHPPVLSFSPSWSIVTQNAHTLLGFGSFIRQWNYGTRFGFRIPLGIIREFVVNPQIVSTPRGKRTIYTRLLKHIERLALIRHCGGIFLPSTAHDPVLQHLLSHLGYFRIPAGMCMIKFFNPATRFTRDQLDPHKTIRLNPGELFMYP